jgi:hypothetical protein
MQQCPKYKTGAVTTRWEKGVRIARCQAKACGLELEQLQERGTLLPIWHQRVPSQSERRRRWN